MSQGSSTTPTNARNLFIDIVLGSAFLVLGLVANLLDQPLLSFFVGLMALLFWIALMAWLIYELRRSSKSPCGLIALPIAGIAFALILFPFWAVGQFNHDQRVSEPVPPSVITIVAVLPTDIPLLPTATLALPTDTLTPEPDTPALPTLAATPTIGSTPTETPIPHNDRAYDAFDDGCINKSLWGMFVDGQTGTSFLPTPVGQCWDVEQQGLSEQSGYISFDRTNTAVREQGFVLAQQPGRTFTRVKLDLSVESLSGEWGGVGLFTRVSKLNDETEPWVHYWLRFGGDLPTNQGRVVYDEHETTRGEGTLAFSQSTTVTLELRWDGQTMSFYVNGSPALKAVPFSGFSDTFGIYWVTGPNSSLKAQIDSYQVTWK